MGIPVAVKMNGMNNRALPNALPENKARNAVNVIFDNDGNIIFPNPGKVIQYAGDCKWLHKGHYVTLFVEGGSLKKLNADYTATVLKTGLDSNYTGYTVVGSDTYWANALATGIVNSAGVNREWGTARPARQPDCTAVAYGGMFAGDYRVAITWLGSTGEEGGIGNSKRVTVAEGGGIHVANFPTPPAYVTGVAVYVSSVNGKDMYLYGEYAANIDSITLTKRILTIPLSTQFAFTPRPKSTILAHYGRIYYAYNDKLYFTELRRYGLQKAGNFWRFDSDIQVIVSCPGVLYIGTNNELGKVTNIDGDGPPVFEKLQDCGAVKGSECYHQNGASAYCMSNRGFLQFRPEGVTEISYTDVAIPLFKIGTSSIRYQDGLETLIFVGQDGIQNKSANKEYNIMELNRGSL